MHTIEVNGTRLCYEIHGASKETIVFSHGLLMNAGMFSAQAEALKDRYRCIICDHLGQGRSAVPDSGFDMDNVTLEAILADDRKGVTRAAHGVIDREGV